jgi:hypothetical protein
VPSGTEDKAKGGDPRLKPEAPMRAQLVAAFAIPAVLMPAILIPAVCAPPAAAQSAPGANPELAVLSLDLQNSRNSALSIQAQAEEKRKLKALAVRGTEATAPADEAASAGGDFTVTIPTGNGLVPRVRAIVAKTESRPGSIETAGGQHTDTH